MSDKFAGLWKKVRGKENENLRGTTEFCPLPVTFAHTKTCCHDQRFV